MKIYPNVKKYSIVNNKNRDLNIQKDKKILEKLKEIIDLSIKLYFIILILILFLDYSLMINLFNIETGYFNIILSENGILPFNLSYIFIPYLFIFIFLFSGILSFQLSLILKNIANEVYFLLNNTNIFRSDNKISINEKFKEIFKFMMISIISSIMIFNLEKITEIIGKTLEDANFNQFFMIIIIEFIILKAIISFLSLKYLKSYNQRLFFEIVIVLIICIFLINNYYKDSNYSILLSYFIYHIVSEIHYDSYLNKKNILLNRKDEGYGIFFKMIVVFFMIALFYSLIDSFNIKQWKKPIIINNDKKAFLNGSYNFLFNRGLLLNNKELINIKISKQYLKYLDISSEQYLKDNSCEIYDTGIVYKFLDNVQYLQLGKNFKMYFKSINFEDEQNKTLIFLIKEKEDKFELVELSSYDNKK